jgi:phage replication initiation protein
MLNVLELVGKVPPSSNTGGKYFPSSVFIDWLSFSWEWERIDAKGMCGMLASWFSARVALQDRGRGFTGFRQSSDIVTTVAGESVVVGMMAWGGGSQGGRAFVSLPGSACGMISPHLWSVVRMNLERVSARITRVDLACDDLEGRYPVETAVEWYRAGDFITGGTPPSYDCKGDWLELSGAGRTFYVGKGKNGKLLRVYEKGRQLGDVDSPWVRWELQLGSKDRVIPYDALTRRGDFFAGGYRCLARVVEAAAERIATARLVFDQSLERLVVFARRSYGRLIHVLLREYQGDAAAVTAKLVLAGVPASLRGPFSAASAASGSSG